MKLIVSMTIGFALYPALAAALTLYNDQAAAEAHCPSETVVWLNTASGVYHFSGERWYDHTKHGAFVCEREADEAGDRATENGQ